MIVPDTCTLSCRLVSPPLSVHTPLHTPHALFRLILQLFSCTATPSSHTGIYTERELATNYFCTEFGTCYRLQQLYKLFFQLFYSLYAPHAPRSFPAFINYPKVFLSLVFRFFSFRFLYFSARLIYIFVAAINFVMEMCACCTGHSV